MITEDYVSLEVAKLLKERGFDAECHAYYIMYADGSKKFCVSQAYPEGHNFNGGEEYEVSAPTLQMSMKWLREEHNLYINIFVTWKNKIPHYQWSIDNLITQDTIYDTPCLEKYEEACDEAIKYCLENLIGNEN